CLRFSYSLIVLGEPGIPVIRGSRWFKSTVVSLSRLLSFGFDSDAHMGSKVLDPVSDRSIWRTAGAL
ncbi:hypothetical protein PtrEW4_011251, partial [Pyrenophora tritici-repentis]